MHGVVLEWSTMAIELIYGSISAEYIPKSPLNYFQTAPEAIGSRVY